MTLLATPSATENEHRLKFSIATHLLGVATEDIEPNGDHLESNGDHEPNTGDDELDIAGHHSEGPDPGPPSH